MDLLSTVRKSGSRGGVNFSWDDVASSNHRENYLGHSLKAPVGRWQKGRDLNWYAKSDATAAESGETDEERIARERREEIRRIKEAEEDAISRALGLPITPRNVTGANAVEVDGSRVGNAAEEEGQREKIALEARGRDAGHREGREHERRHHRKHRDRSRDGSRDRRRPRDRDRSRDRSKNRRPRDEERKRRSRSRDYERPDKRYRRDRSRSPDHDEDRRLRRRSRSTGRDRGLEKDRRRSLSPRRPRDRR